MKAQIIKIARRKNNSYRKTIPSAIQTASPDAGFKTHLTLGVDGFEGFWEGRRIRDSKNDPEGGPAG